MATKKKKAVILSTHWKERVNWKDVKAALNELGFKVYINMVYSGSDEDVVVLSNEEISIRKAQDLYDKQNK